MLALEQINDRARQLHEDSIIIDACSFFLHGFTDVVAESGATAIAFTTPMPWDDFDTTVRRTEEYYLLAREESRLRLVESTADIRAAKAEGQLGIILFAQSPAAIGDRLARVETMRRLGYRIIQLTYSERNYVGDGANEPSDVGLSLFGRDLVREMNVQGIVVDLAHAGQRTALEAAALSSRPVIVSHTNPRSLYPTPRNIIDEVIDAVAGTGGVIGASPFGLLNWDGRSSEPPRLEQFLDAVDYLVQRAGIDHVGIGTDSEATEGAYPASVRAELRRRYGNLVSDYGRAFGADAPEHVVPFRGMRDLPLITEQFLERGYGEDDVRKLLGGNFLRVYEAVWPA